jgi:D-alanyl-lipoteichoic acid acyltransferase DltB (MBOAT superfamily)
MAWGTAIALGYRLPENFNMPYKSTSMTEFWQRWHISLIKWIRDYLYIPLGGNRVSALRHKFNIFITMFLAGLWHGANWTFVFWGATQGLVMAIENIIKLALGITNDNKSKFKIYNYLNNNTVFRFSTIVIMFSYTMCLTMISAAIFRSNTIHDFFVIFTRLFALDSFPNEIPQISLYRPVIMGILALVIGHTIGNYIFEKKTFRWNVHPAYEITLIPVLILILTQIVANDVAAFVYFVF